MYILKWTVLSFLSLLLITSWSQAATVKVEKRNPKAYMKRSSDNRSFYANLDLVRKRIKFDKSDLSRCRKTMWRDYESVDYECEIPLPNKSSTHILSKQISPKSLLIRYGKAKKRVYITVAKKANKVKLKAKFKPWSIDFDSFDENAGNNEISLLIEEAAIQIFARAMASRPLIIEVLEN